MRRTRPCTSIGRRNSTCMEHNAGQSWCLNRIGTRCDLPAQKPHWRQHDIDPQEGSVGTLGAGADAHPPLESSGWLSLELLLSLEFSFEFSFELSFELELLFSLLLELGDEPLVLGLSLASGVLGVLPPELPAPSSGEGVSETLLSMSVALSGSGAASPESAGLPASADVASSAVYNQQQITSSSR